MSHVLTHIDDHENTPSFDEHIKGVGKGSVQCCQPHTKQSAILVQPEVRFLGHTSLADGIRPDPKKVIAIEVMKTADKPFRET
jgi:hypothetical protein